MDFRDEAYKYEPLGLWRECPSSAPAGRSHSRGTFVMKRHRRIRRDESGVASTVGTIMALLVFLTFISLIVNQYVPVWMKDSEASHMGNAFGQFGAFKGSVDLQMLAAQMAANAGVDYIPISSFTPVTLGVDGIPIFTTATLGTLNSYSDKDPFTTQLVYRIRGVNTQVTESSLGVIILEVFNRYYLHGTLGYENGAVIRAQIDGQSVRAEPTFEVTIVNNTVRIATTHVGLFGSGSVEGSTTEGIHSKLIGVDRQDYTQVRSDLWLNGSTPFGVAWISFYNRTLAAAFNIDAGVFSGGCPTYCFSAGYLSGRVQSLSIVTPYYKLTAQWKDPKQAYDLTVPLYNDPDNTLPLVMPISVVRVQKAFVNVAIAEKGTEVSI